MEPNNAAAIQVSESIVRIRASLTSMRVSLNGLSLPFAAFVATNELLGRPILASCISEFREFTKHKCRAASQERGSTVNTNQFFEELMSGMERGLYDETTAKLQRFFKVKCLNSATWYSDAPPRPDRFKLE